MGKWPRKTLAVGAPPDLVVVSKNSRPPKTCQFAWGIRTRTCPRCRKARENAAKAGMTNVEFRLGEMEALPVADDSVDVIICNCVMNLSPEKPKVFEEAFCVLKGGGRLAVTDIVATAQLPGEVKQDLALHVACVAGAAPMDELKSMLEGAGFADVRIAPLNGSRDLVREWAPDKNLEDFIASATIEAIKPRRKREADMATD